MKKILFGITSLTIGGAERVLVDLANRLSEEYSITILTIYDKGELKKQLNENVKVISLYDMAFKDYNKLDRIAISLDLFFKIKPPKGYDIYVSFLEGPITRFFSKKIQKNEAELNIKRIAWVHNDISKVFGNNLKAKFKVAIDKKVYQKYDEIVFVSNENKDDFEKTYGKIKKIKNSDKCITTSVIRNYINYKSVIEKSEQKPETEFDNNCINLVSVCRLVEQKALDRFIKVHSMLEKDGIHSKVYVIGDGPNKGILKKTIEKYNEKDNFFLLGQKENPYPYIKNADYFCLLSYYEGYGMVIDEAKILNKKIIITKTAAKEGIANYEQSYVLDNNEKGIYEGLKKILSSDIILNDQIEENQTDNVKKYYDEIIAKVKSLF